MQTKFPIGSKVWFEYQGGKTTGIVKKSLLGDEKHIDRVYATWTFPDGHVDPYGWMSIERVFVDAEPFTIENWSID